jgi:fumarate reductase subunit C
MDQPLNPDYRPHHPKWHRRRMPIFWWVRKYRYFRFIARELTSLAVGYAAVLLMVQAWALARGPEAQAGFEAWLRTPAVMALHVFVFLALAFHAVTWFNLAPRALALRLGGRRLPDGVVLFAHYAAWLTVSGLVGWALMGG